MLQGSREQRMETFLGLSCRWLRCGAAAWRCAWRCARRTGPWQDPGAAVLVNIDGRCGTEARGPRPGRSFASFRGRLGFLLAPSTALEWDERLGGKASTWLCVPLLSEWQHLGLGLRKGLSVCEVGHCPGRIRGRGRRGAAALSAAL